MVSMNATRMLLAKRCALQTAAIRTAPHESAAALHWQRRFVQTQTSKPAAAASNNATAATANANGEGAAVGAEGEVPKYKPGWFSRNPGTTLGGIVLAIGLYVYRGTQNKKNFDAIQAPIAEEAVISPYEAWELRSANDVTYVSVDGISMSYLWCAMMLMMNACLCVYMHVINRPETYESVRSTVFKAFSTGKAAMEHFDRYLGYKLGGVCPNGLRNAVCSSCSLVSIF